MVKHIFISVGIILMLSGAFSLDRITIGSDKLTITPYTFWGLHAYDTSTVNLAASTRSIVERVRFTAKGLRRYKYRLKLTMANGSEQTILVSQLKNRVNRISAKMNQAILDHEVYHALIVKRLGFIYVGLVILIVGIIGNPHIDYSKANKRLAAK